MFKTMKSKVSDVCRKVLVPAFAGAVYTASKLIEKVMVYAEGRIEVVWKFEDNVEMLNIG